MKKLLSIIFLVVFFYLQIAHNSGVAFAIFQENTVKNFSHCENIHPQEITHDCCFIKDFGEKKSPLLSPSKSESKKLVFVKESFKKFEEKIHISKIIYIKNIHGPPNNDGENFYTSLIGIIKNTV